MTDTRKTAGELVSMIGNIGNRPDIADAQMNQLKGIQELVQDRIAEAVATERERCVSVVKAHLNFLGHTEIVEYVAEAIREGK